jgi:hypothetical protein
MPQPLFALVIFSESQFFAWGWHRTITLIPIAFCVAKITGIYHHSWFIIEMGSHKLFCLGWPPNVILQRNWDYRHKAPAMF